MTPTTDHGTTDPGTFGERVAAKREEMGLTQDELGAKLDITGQYLSKIERDTVEASEKLKLAIARELGVPVAWLKDGPPPSGRASADLYPNRDAVARTETFKQQPERVREQFLTQRRDDGQDLPEADWGVVLAGLRLLYDKGVLRSHGGEQVKARTSAPTPLRSRR